LCFFLWGKGLNAKHSHIEIFTVYGEKCLSRKAFHNWVEKFSQERSKVADDARPGRPVEIATEATVQQVKEMIRAGRKIATDSVATALRCLMV
jgi:transposase